MTTSRREFLQAAALVGAAAAAAPATAQAEQTQQTRQTPQAQAPQAQKAQQTQQTEQAPGGPGADTTFTPADKLGFGTARGAESAVWFTLEGGRISETYHPDLSTPASRETQWIVTDGETFVERVTDVTHRTEAPDPRVPSYRQVATGTGWTLTTRVVTDPARAAVLVDVDFRARKPLQIFVLHDPALGGEGTADSAFPQDGALVASDGRTASALLAGNGFSESTVGYSGVNDGWTELSANQGRLLHHYATAGPGNVIQVARLRLDGRTTTRETVVLGFGSAPGEAVGAAQKSLRRGFTAVAKEYAQGWNSYLAGLPETPGSVGKAKDVYTTSVLMLACSEDKRNPGAFIASPSMPWAFGFDRAVAPEYGSYHLVWPRDLYQIATGLLAAGDRAAAGRALDYLLRIQQPDGHWAQNTKVSGEPFWTSIQLDETAAPMLLAWLLDRHDPSTVDKLARGGDFLLSYPGAPFTEQERWEEQNGYSPSTIASVIAGLVCLADLLAKAGRDGTKYLATADNWAAAVDGWTVTRTGPLSPRPYYVRLTKDGDPDAGTTYNLGNNNPGQVDQRAVADAGFLELVRLGIKPAGDPVVENSLTVVDAQISTATPAGRHWHRYSSDGYGEQADGNPWNVNRADLQRTYGRLWPIFAGERGEYELLNGDARAAAGRLADMAATAGETGLLPEQVWDTNPPYPRTRPGTPTASATPLAWTHAQFVRLAWSVQRGRPVEYPDVVAERYLKRR
ncbi:twin-arginine translocation signal domain-containing protein [Amycolatopsis acidicola]|uniref:Twin-arginine translocation signal domain-containing protein n=1 Tax=Amycolatopsis acidicola TaxID=2596893 RepID=A0A5N0UU55_9PSEU|nr:glycoside hydrolase family 15 protein [Amycolatopsis acidicola]KAA9153157.1 twin-arginine translocation signal domain-containing protein [Amycolatopsis acidicola]